MRLKGNTYRDSESKTANSLRDGKETRWVHCYCCDRLFKSYQFDVRKCNACRRAYVRIKSNNIDLTLSEMKNIDNGYFEFMKRTGRVINVFGRSLR